MSAELKPGEQAPAKREVLYYMFRPEWLQMCKINVSSDVFTKFGIDNSKGVMKRRMRFLLNSPEHEEEVSKISAKLVTEHIPKFVQWLVENNSKVSSVYCY